MNKYSMVLQGFLDALHNYSNYNFIFEEVDAGKAQRIQKDQLEKMTKAEVEVVFKIWLLNSTADFFYQDKYHHYTPILDRSHWEKLPNYSLHNKLVDRKMEQFFDILQVDFLLQKPHEWYKYPFGGQSVISNDFLMEINNVYYIFSLGWDD